MADSGIIAETREYCNAQIRIAPAKRMMIPTRCSRHFETSSTRSENLSA